MKLNFIWRRSKKSHWNCFEFWQDFKETEHVLENKLIVLPLTDDKILSKFISKLVSTKGYPICWINSLKFRCSAHDNVQNQLDEGVSK